MARITIEDLPVSEELSKAEMEELYGAGRPSFRPGIEVLDERIMPYSPGRPFIHWGDIGWGSFTHHVTVSQPAHQIQVSYEALNTSLGNTTASKPTVLPQTSQVQTGSAAPLAQTKIPDTTPPLAP